MAKYNSIAEFIDSGIPACIEEVTRDDRQMFLTAEETEAYLERYYPNCWENRMFDETSVGPSRLDYDYWEGDPSFSFGGETSAYILNIPEIKHTVIAAYWESEEDYSLQIGDDEPKVVARNSYAAREAARNAREAEEERAEDDETYTAREVRLYDSCGDECDF